MFFLKKTKHFFKKTENGHTDTQIAKAAKYDEQKDIVIKRLITQEYLASLFFCDHKTKPHFQL